MKYNFTMMIAFAIFVCVQNIFGYVPMQVDLFKKDLQSSTSVANCANCDFRGVQNLAGVDAHGAKLPGASFQPCVQTATNKDTLMVCVPNQPSDLTKINIANGNLYSSCLDAVILDEADLSGTDFTNSSVQYASLKGAKVRSMVTTNATFCNSVMPDGKVCTDTWSGQGVVVACNCEAKPSKKTTSKK